MLEKDLAFVIQKLARPTGELVALDACGGSGNVTHKLLIMGLKVTLCDISQELTERCTVRTQDYTSDLKVVNAEITQFLSEDKTLYDLIIYSSALHHLENYPEVLRLSFKRLKSGGILYTVFDPALSTRMGIFPRILLGFDYFLFKVRFHPMDTLAGVMRRLRRFLASKFSRPEISEGSRREDFERITPDYLGVLAEYYARTGIDDLQLAADLEQMGFSIILHERYAEARHDFFRRILTSMQEITSFKFVLQKPG
jgi:ubiquinone/menaquinone biosynthesis C-methylase UbiE